MRVRLGLAAVVAVGVGLRLWLALVVFPGSGYAGDLQSFLTWAAGFAERGPAGFYGGDSSANYPPVAIWMYAALEALSHPLAAATQTTAAQALLLLLKVPAVLADGLTALIVYDLGRRWRSPRIGLVAAAAFLVVPPVWYVSALWGQIDSVLTVFCVAALALLLRSGGIWSHLSAVCAVCAVLVKPQGILVVLVVGVVLLASLLRRDGAGRRHVARLLSTVAVAAGAGLALIVPFDYEALAGPATRGVPVVGDLAGFVAQSVGTGDLFPVVSANAYNLWALAGDPSLARTIGTGTALWNVDTLPVLGVAAGLLGVTVFAAVTVLVLAGLVIRHDLVGVLLGFTVLSYAFFTVPTRVHERYLLPVFATAAVLAAPTAIRLLAYALAGLLQLINLHAVLAAGLGLAVRAPDGSLSAVGGGPLRGSGGGRGNGGGGGGPAPDGGPSPGGAPPDGGGGSGVGGGAGGGGFGADPGRPQNIRLPLADLARAEWMVWLVAIAQTAIMAVLLVVWVVAVTAAVRRARGAVAAG